MSSVFFVVVVVVVVVAVVAVVVVVVVCFSLLLGCSEKWIFCWKLLHILNIHERL